MQNQSIQEAAQEARVDASGGIVKIVKELLAVKPSMDVAYDVLKDSSICSYAHMSFGCKLSGELK